MPDATDTIVSITPKRGRGPGRVLFKSGLDLGTFDGALVRTAAGFIGQEVALTWEETTGKNGKTYQNLLTLTPVAPPEPQTGPVESEVAPGSTIAPHPLPSLPIRAEVLSQALVVPQDTMAQLEQGFALAVRRYELLQDFIKKHFVKDIHYNDGKMFGASKDVLLQPGAHMIAHAYGYSLLPEVIAGPLQAPSSPEEHYTMVVKTTVINTRGHTVGVAYGSATSTIWSGKQGRYIGRAIDPDKIHNSTFKIAVKRSVVAAVRQSTDASSLFVEDVEEQGYHPPGEGSEEKKNRKFIRS